MSPTPPAPLSERHMFVKQSACVFNGSEAWSLSDLIPYWSVPSGMHHKAHYPDAVFASDLRSILVRDPARRVYHAVMDVQNLRNEVERMARGTKNGMEPDVSTKP